MSIYQVAAALVAGICFAYGLLYLFVGMRRSSDRTLSLTFALFALAYAGTVFNGIRFHTTDSLETYVALVRSDTLFVVAAWVGLIWFVSHLYQDRGQAIPFVSDISVCRGWSGEHIQTCVNIWSSDRPEA